MAAKGKLKTRAARAREEMRQTGRLAVSYTHLLIAGEHAGRLLSDEMKCAPCLYRYPLDERPGEKFPVESR